MKMRYIIDFERLNQLATGHTISCGILQNYIDIYMNRKNYPNLNPELIEHIIETLSYNRILIGDIEKRDKKIENILK